jgi:hypothetical protein
MTKNNKQRITSYISGAGLKIYEIEQYNADTDRWYIVGDCSQYLPWMIYQVNEHNKNI